MILLRPQLVWRAVTVLALSMLLMVYATPVQAAGDCGTLQKQINTYGANANNFAENLPHFCTFSQLAQRVLNIAFILIGGVTVVFIILGGYRYMVAGGNTEAATKGKQTVVWAVIGLVVVIMAATLVNIFINLIVNNKVI